MTEKRSLLRSPGILFVALIVMIAAAGLVYAHWTTTLLVQANVNTGRVDVEWQNMFTNDDGVPNPGDGELASNTLYDAWGNSVTYRRRKEPAGYVLHSDGPDGQSGTSDDIEVRR